MTQTHDRKASDQANPDALMQELQTARTQLARVKKRRARYKLDRYRAGILLLRENDATYGEIQRVLARHRINVSPMTIRNALIRWQKEDAENTGSASGT